MNYNGYSFGTAGVLDAIKGNLIQPSNITIGTSPNTYSFPATVGLTGQILKLITPNQLDWKDDGSTVKPYKYIVNPNLPNGNGNYQTIQAAITASEADPAPRSPILITPATYTENLTMLSTCHLTGSAAEAVLINGSITLGPSASQIFLERIQITNPAGHLFIGSNAPLNGVVLVLNFVTIQEVSGTLYNFSNFVGQGVIIINDSVYHVFPGANGPWVNVGLADQCVMLLENMTSLTAFTASTIFPVNNVLFYVHNGQISTSLTIRSASGSVNINDTEILDLHLRDGINANINGCEITNKPGLILGNNDTILTNTIFTGTGPDFNVKLSTFSNPTTIAISNVTILAQLTGIDPALAPYITSDIHNYTYGENVSTTLQTTQISSQTALIDISASDIKNENKYDGNNLGTLINIKNINNLTPKSLLVMDFANNLVPFDYNVSTAKLCTNGGGDLFALIPQFVNTQLLTPANTMFAFPGIYQPLAIGVQVGTNSTDMNYNAGDLVYTANLVNANFRQQRFIAKFTGTCLALLGGVDYHEFAWFFNGTIISGSITRVYVDTVRPTQVTCIGHSIYGGGSSLDFRVLSSNVANTLQATSYSINIFSM